MNMQSHRTYFQEGSLNSQVTMPVRPTEGNLAVHGGRKRQYVRTLLLLSLAVTTAWLLGPTGFAIVAGVAILLLAGALAVCAYALDNTRFY